MLTVTCQNCIPIFPAILAALCLTFGGFFVLLLAYFDCFSNKKSRVDYSFGNLVTLRVTANQFHIPCEISFTLWRVFYGSEPYTWLTPLESLYTPTRSPMPARKLLQEPLLPAGIHFSSPVNLPTVCDPIPDITSIAGYPVHPYRIPCRNFRVTMSSIHQSSIYVPVCQKYDKIEAKDLRLKTKYTN